jgi:FMN phosphatase YigB (HAD superfamily)
LDVDGTLYHQKRLRCLMALELSTLPCTMLSFDSASRIWRSLAQYRRVREELRGLGRPEQRLAQLQYVEAAKRIGGEPGSIETLVSEWVMQRPLKYLKICRRRGIEAFCAFLAGKAIQIGVFSDYPVAEKIAGLGLSRWISVALCATDPEINAFKPHSAGFLRACSIWGLSPDEVLYVGDRAEVDAVGAAWAGMPCAILGRGAGASMHSPSPHTYLSCTSFAELRHLLAPLI